MDYKVTKTPFERAEPVGRELVRQAKEAHDYRKNWANKEIGQAAKEAATYLSGCARGKVSITMDANDWVRIFGRGNVKKHKR